jgi:cohesin loading factor subunit SCC2
MFQLIMDIVGDNSVITGASNEARSSQHQRLLSCLTTLYLFSKVRPELLVNHAETMQPYLSMSISGQLEQQVLNQVSQMKYYCKMGKAQISLFV